MKPDEMIPILKSPNLKSPVIGAVKIEKGYEESLYAVKIQDETMYYYPTPLDRVYDEAKKKEILKQSKQGILQVEKLKEELKSMDELTYNSVGLLIDKHTQEFIVDLETLWGSL